jgi:hypothetical protein
MNANDRQVGGTHYASKFQHWDFIEHYGVGYLEGCLTKYVTRHHKKNGLEDLLKASHYLDKLIELYPQGRRSRMFEGVTLAQVEEFITANNLGQLEGEICVLVFSDYDACDLAEAKSLLIQLITNTKKNSDIKRQNITRAMLDQDGMENPFGYVFGQEH